VKAVVVREFGPPEQATLSDFASPQLSDGHVLVDVQAAGINFPDLLVIAGKYQILPQRPFVAGKECAGVVRAVGKGVTTCAPGDRVLVEVEHGAFAQEVVAPQEHCFVLPAEMSFDQAAGFGLVYLTSHFALVERARMKAGEVVLVTGATGGIGLAAVHIAKALGATVVAAVSTPEKAAIARANGADHVIDTSVPNLRESMREQLRAATGKRMADVVVESVGGDVFDAALRCLAWCGRLVVVGFAGGRIPEVKANYLLVKNIAVMGLQISDYRDRTPESMRKVMNELFDLVRQGRIVPVVSAALPAARVGEACALLSGRKAVGKVVVRMQE